MHCTYTLAIIIYNYKHKNNIQKNYSLKNISMIPPRGKKQENLAGRSTPFHRVKPATQKSYTGQGQCNHSVNHLCQPAVFLVSFLFGRIIATFFSKNVFVYVQIDTFVLCLQKNFGAQVD